MACFKLELIYSLGPNQKYNMLLVCYSCWWIVYIIRKLEESHSIFSVWPLSAPQSQWPVFHCSWHSVFAVWPLVVSLFGTQSSPSSVFSSSKQSLSFIGTCSSQSEQPCFSLFFRFGGSPSPISQSMLSQSLFSLYSCFRCMTSASLSSLSISPFLPVGNVLHFSHCTTNKSKTDWIQLEHGMDVHTYDEYIYIPWPHQLSCQCSAHSGSPQLMLRRA